MGRDRCPDCNQRMISIYSNTTVDLRKTWNVIGRMCPHCFYTKYFNEGATVTLSKKTKKNKDDNLLEDIVLPKVSSEVVEKILSDPQTVLKQLKLEKVKRRLLVGILRQDPDISKMLDERRGINEIREFLRRRELQPFKGIYDKAIDDPISDSELVHVFRNEKSIDTGLYYSNSLSDEKFLQELKKYPDDLEKAKGFIQRQRKYWHGPKQTSETIN